MKTLLKISWRNVWRNPKRSLIMILAITIGLWGGIFAASLSFGLISQRFELTIVQHVSHIQVHNPDFLKDQNIKYGLNEWEELEKSIAGHKDIMAYSPRTIMNGMLASANLTRGVNIIGIDPQMEAATTGLYQNTIEGSYLNHDKPNQILVGKKLAEKTKIQQGSRVVLTYQGFDGELIAGTFRVAGIFQTSNSAYDDANIYVLQTDLANYLDQPDYLNEVAILAYDIDQVFRIGAELGKLHPDLSIRVWSDISPELSYMQEMAETMLILLLVIILLALAFGLANTMLMAVYERIREIGVLMAIGMNKKRIFTMITIETVFLTFLGALGGILTGSLSIQLFQRTGLDLGAVGGDTINEWGFPSLVYPQLEASFFGMLVILVVITSLATSIFPSMKALHLHPAEAIRKE